jgi:hypothetical protein
MRRASRSRDFEFGPFDHKFRHHRYPGRPGDPRQPDDHRGDDPVVAVSRLRRPLGGAVAEPRCRPHLLTASSEEGAVDRDVDRLARRDQQRHHHPCRGQAEFAGTPPGAGEEAVRPVVRPQPRQARAGEHAADGAPTGLGKETAGQPAERAERRRREQRRESRQQHHQGRRKL